MPFQLSTIEAVQKIYAMLNDNGVIVVNIPSALRGERGKFFQAEYETYKKIFPVVRVFAVTSPEKEDIVQNIILFGFKSRDIRTTLNDDPETNKLLKHEWIPKEDGLPILTDEYAPVDFYINKFLNLMTM